MLDPVKLMPRRIPAGCKAEAHRLGVAQQVGPGIVRRVCVHCTHVSIDLTAEDALIDPSLFTERSGTNSART
jgi:hypothetical protein